MTNVKIFYEINQGDKNKRPLVFLHGLGGDLTAWNRVRKYFSAQKYTTLALDFRGFGLSDRPDSKKSYELNNFADDVIEIMRKEHLEKPVIVGHCFGGMIAMILTGLHPHLASSLILVATGYKTPYFAEPIVVHPFFNKIVSFVADHSSFSHINTHTDFNEFIGTTDFDWKRILSDIRHTSLKSYLFAINNVFYFNASEYLNKIKIPTLIVAGEDDKIFPPEVAAKIHGFIKNSKLENIPNANHILIINNPKEVSQIIENFLQNLKT